MSEKPIKILIAASGSGGHLFPAVYIADALKEISPGCMVEFVGSGRRLEGDIIDSRGYKRHQIDIVGLSQKGLLGFLLKAPGAWRATSRIFKEFRPDAVIGVGGYVSILPVIMGRLRGLPTWVHEGELSAGMANRLLSLFASRVSTAFAETRLPWWSKKVFTGHPIRPDVVELGKQQPGFPEAPKRVLVMGGSQGASSVDNAMLECIGLLKQNDIEIYHQGRPENLDQIKAGYEAAGIQARVVPFINELSQAYGWADLIVARAGAGTVMEIGCVGVPALFIPFPHAQGDHQNINADTVVKTGKAVKVNEGSDFVDRFKKQLSGLLTTEGYRELVESPKVDRPLDAAAQIAKGVIGLTTEG